MHNTFTAESKTVLITGANSFVGQQLCAEMCQQGWHVKAAVRTPCQFPPGIELVSVGSIDGETDWTEALKMVNVVVHLAARVHVMNDKSVSPLDSFMKINMTGTEHLAQSSAKNGVRRLVYISSIKVNGEETIGEQVFTADDIPAPTDPYAISKYEAEQALITISTATGMDVVIIRPPLVYGPGVKANFRTMMQWLVRGIPLPLGLIHNARSLVALDNLVDFIITCSKHSAAAGQVFLVSDGDDMSTPVLLKRLAKSLSVSARLIPVPVFILWMAAALIGKKDITQRLCGSLRLDIRKNRDVLGWSPPYSVDKGLDETAKAFFRMNVQ